MQVFHLISTVFLYLGLLAALVTAFDLFRHPQPMRIMNIVWPLTCLWAGIFGLWAYYAFGRSRDGKKRTHRKRDRTTATNTKTTYPAADQKMDMASMMAMPDRLKKVRWQTVALATFHCGAGCTLGDILGESLGMWWGIMAAGIGWQWLFDYALALALGVLFQYAAIRPLVRLSTGQTLRRALRIDYLSLTAWQAGMYLFCFIMFYPVLGRPPGQATAQFWFIMQLAMFVGFFFSFPLNRILIRKGIKPAM